MSLPDNFTRNTRLSICRHSGVTLVELILCVGILSVIIASTVPSMSGFLERQRSLSATHTLISHLATARISAVNHKRPVILCPATENLQCIDSIHWGKNWVFFLDADGNRKVDMPQDVLAVYQNPLHGTLQLHSTIGRPQVRYLPNGRSAGSNVTFSICNASGILLAQVIVNNAGRARSSRPKQLTICPN